MKLRYILQVIVTAIIYLLGYYIASKIDDAATKYLISFIFGILGAGISIGIGFALEYRSK
jgi:thiamine pyrophosphate-dependent acetolactate synthase large subunit-like protein